MIYIIIVCGFDSLKCSGTSASLHQLAVHGKSTTYWDGGSATTAHYRLDTGAMLMCMVRATIIQLMFAGASPQNLISITITRPCETQLPTTHILQQQLFIRTCYCTDNCCLHFTFLLQVLEPTTLGSGTNPFRRCTAQHAR